MALNEKELAVIKNVAKSTNAILQQIPVEKVDEVQDLFVAELAALKDSPKPTIVETIQLGLDAIDSGAQLAPETKQGNNFRVAMATIKAIFSILIGQGGGLIQLLSLVGKGKKALK
jgi:hypothetical protein